MKIRNGFVSNSSSCSFYITNTSKRSKTLVDFVKENPQLLENFFAEYDEDRKWYAHLTPEAMLESAKARAMKFPPGKPVYCVFGDEQGDAVGQVFDYMLRDGGGSKNFSWRFDDWQR